MDPSVSILPMWRSRDNSPEVNSFLAPYSIQGLNSSCQACGQVSLPTEQSCQAPRVVFFFFKLTMYLFILSLHITGPRKASTAESLPLLRPDIFKKQYGKP